MEDRQGMKKAVAGVMTDALADGRKPATASNLPPLSNRGGTETETAGRVQEVFECYETYITDGKGKLLGVPLRRGVSDSAFIDQITFSIHEDTFFHVYGLSFDLFDDDDFIRAASDKMEEIFGFGIIEKAKHSGGRFYEGCWLMGTENAQYGRVHFGGQNNTMLFELTAVGCNAANIGWESRLFDFLTNAIRPKITRVDIAKDFFNGEYSPNQAREDRNKGLFTCHHVKPKGECLGSDWEEEDEAKMTRGKTYGIGSRESSKYVRIYEKGKQLGDKTSIWTRFEIEFNSYWEKNRHNPDIVNFKNYNFSRCYFDWNGGSCTVGEDINDARSFISFSLRRNTKYKEEMDAKKLEEILALKVDANPDKYIQATGYPGYSEKVEVAPGTKVNMGPVTDRNGNPVQVVATFGRDAQGNNTVDVQVVPRPDLTPGSAEAPNVRPLPEVSPAENPANNPNPNEHPGTRPNPEPDPDLNPDANPDTDVQPGTSPDSPAVPGRTNGRDGKERKEGEDGGFLCKYFPKILACQEMGKPSDGMFDDIRIPQVTDDKTWSSDNFLPSNGVCPQPKTFHVFGRQYQASYEPLCVFAEKIRFAVLLAFIIMSAFVVFGSLRGK